MADRINQLSSGTLNTKTKAGRAILSKGKLIIPILITLLVMVYCLLGFNYLKQRQAQQELTSQIGETSQTIREIPKPAQDLTQQLETAQASLATEQASFPSQIATTQVINSILGMAEGCGIKAIPMVTQPWSTETVGQHSYRVLRLMLSVEGSLSQLTNFVAQLEKGEYATMVIESLSATKATNQSEEAAAAGTISIAGSLKLAIYTRTAASD